MNNIQRKISVFLAILGAVLILICSLLYIVTKWRKHTITTGDVIATCVISVTSLVVLIVSLVCCCRCCHRNTNEKKVHRKTTYIAITKHMGSDCGICIEPKDSNISTVVKLTCDHTFHKECVNKSLETQHRCPICRQTPLRFSVIERVLYRVYRNLNRPVRSLSEHPNIESTPVWMKTIWCSRIIRIEYWFIEADENKIRVHVFYRHAWEDRQLCQIFW